MIMSIFVSPQGIFSGLKTHEDSVVFYGKIKSNCAPSLLNLGPEPLSDDFEGKHLFLASRKRSISVKPFIMDSKVVVGVGNIYANEALFLAKINPKISAGRVSFRDTIDLHLP